jgi:hypothetical protein
MSQDKKPIQATLQSNAMHKIKVADLSIRPRFRERTDMDPSFVWPLIILGSQEDPRGKNRPRLPGATGHSSIN